MKVGLPPVVVAVVVVVVVVVNLLRDNLHGACGVLLLLLEAIRAFST